MVKEPALVPALDGGRVRDMVEVAVREQKRVDLGGGKALIRPLEARR